MKRHLKNFSRRETARRDAAEKVAPKGRRLWLFRLAAVVFGPLLVLSSAELALRLAKYGHSTSFFKPTRINGDDCLVENDQFGLRFFPPELARSPSPMMMRARKPPGTYRIFLLGESAALGDPAPAFGVGRYLQALLRERYPDTDFEVVCVAMTAINSHAILPIARECARYEGDLWILYMGNNEMVGPFGAATVFGAKTPPGWLVRLRLALGETRLMQGLAGLSDRWRGQRHSRNWEGMKLFLEHRLPPDDPTRETVYRNFRANLEGILRAGERAGVPILLSTVAVNLRDFPPLASLPGRDSGTNLPPEFLRLSATAASARSSSDWQSAIQAYESAGRLVPHHAEVHFRLGQCQLAVSNHTSALASFSQARDNDALPFRADSRLNGIIEQTGRAHANRGVQLFDAVAAMSAHGASGIPGDESFYEHVHYTFDGNYRLARALAETVAAQLPANVTKRTTTEWSTQEKCELNLGLTDWNRRDVLDHVVRRLSQPPFTGQPDNAARVSMWRERLTTLRKQLNATNAAAARAIYVEAIQRSSADFRLHSNFAEFLEAIRDLPGATEEWRKVQSLVPHHHVGHYQLGRLLAQQGRRDEARKSLSEALRLRPDLAAGWLELGILSLAEGKGEDALQQLARARQLVPQDPQIYFQTAKALSQLKRSEEAILKVREALQLDPNLLEARSFLGEELAFAGRVGEAQREFEVVLRLKPDHPWAHLNLGVALFKQGRREEAVRHFEEALRLDPQLAPAKQYLEQLRSQPTVNP